MQSAVGSEKPIRWGIIGTGNIAHKFAQALRIAKGANLTAVGSRFTATALKFAAEFGIDEKHAHGSYSDLAEDPEVDVVYISTPHHLHAPDAMMCLKAIVSYARERKLFLMEAVWSRFLPYSYKVRELLSEIGDVVLLQADFGINGTRHGPESRLFNPSLAGGALLDVGVYIINLSSMVFKKQPEKIVAFSQIGGTNVDDSTSMLFLYNENQKAALSCSVVSETPRDAYIVGTKGTIKIHPMVYCSKKVTLIKNGEVTVFETPYEGNGLHNEAEEVMQCLRKGQLESNILPLDESIANMTAMDHVRDQIKLKYPFEG